MVMSTVNEKMTAIAEPIRSLMKETDKLSLDEMADRVSQIAEANENLEKTLYGTDFGGTGLYDEGYEAHRLRFWNAFVESIQEDDWMSRLYQWTDMMFDPPFPLKPIYADYMFDGSKITKIHANQVDFSECVSFYQTFGTVKSLTEIEVLDLRKAETIYRMCYAATNLRTIGQLIFNGNGTVANNVSGAFGMCSSLQNVSVSGRIGKTLSFSSSPLSNESAKSILLALINYAGTEDEGAFSITFKSTVKEALIAEGATAPGDITWDEYVLAKGWDW